MSLRTYLRALNDLNQHLTAHHSIEEKYVFPILATRMPSFAENEEHRQSHEGIHKGLDRLGALTKTYREDPTSFSPEEVRKCLESFKDVLMRHMDDEVKDLGAENMKKYWKLEEIDELGF
ncbi:hypothetical protein BD410DRAFT_744576 [Rickenella mellea]|uniref:Hemerythrin-like domain-containing protein n=1 Tax=Rickenella mellea TaxID=50990 RepID=A0A4Y7QB26_9AGAM|nr:hypothetical protein BD410DRAFT_744576 [Rickenella mellea]